MRRKLLADEKNLFPNELREIFNKFEKAGFEIYLVGDGVRKILMGKTPINCDLTTNATPEQIQEVMAAWEPYYDNAFGTVGMVARDLNEIYEITTFRSEKGYSDFRRPDEVTWGKTLEEDVKRRDFTVSAMVISSEELIDLVDGMKDFEMGIIRAVGDPNQRFGEDALRMMRAIRQAASLSFVIEKDTLDAIKIQAPLLKNISGERIRDELLKILMSDYAPDGVRLLITTGLMNWIIPELLDAYEMEQTGHHTLSVLDHVIEALRYCQSKDPIVRLAVLIHDIGKPKSRRWRCKNCGKWLRNVVIGEMITCPECSKAQTSKEVTTFYGHEVVGARMASEIADRLKFSTKQREKLVTLVRWHMFSYQKEMTDAAIRRFIRRVGKENINDIILLRIADRKGSGSKTTSWRLMEMQKRVGEQLFEPMEVRDMAIDGRDVMAVLGIKPGPKIGEVLNKLFEEVLEDTSKNNREYLLSRIKLVA